MTQPSIGDRQSVASLAVLGDLIDLWKLITGDRRKVSVLAHRAYFQVPGSPEMCFIKVTNLSHNRPVTITHVWFATSPEVDVVNPERPLPKSLGIDEQWETWWPVSALQGADSIETLARVVLANSPKRSINAKLNESVRPYGNVAGP